MSLIPEGAWEWPGHRSELRGRALPGEVAEQTHWTPGPGFRLINMMVRRVGTA